MNAINVEIVRGHNENTASMVRKFTRGMQSSGILSRMRKIRYFSRSMSKATTKKQALAKLKSREKYTELVKLGKIAEGVPTKKKGGRRR
jgi:ribosomal protein S21